MLPNTATLLPLQGEAEYNNTMSAATATQAVVGALRIITPVRRAVLPKRRVTPSARPVAPPARPYSRILLTLPFLPLLFLALMPTVYNHVRAASILMVIADM